MNEILLSIVSPVYRAESIVPTLIKRIEESVSKITTDYEIILVEDCGPDNSWYAIEKIAKSNPKVIGIKLSRNFGQHYAITAGLDHCKGEWIVVMDCDLQDQPEEILKLYAKALEGYDIVLARRAKRKDKFFKKNFSRLFYNLMSFLSGMEFDATVANFGIYNKKVINAVCNMKESIRVFPIMVKWIGFKTEKIDVNHSERLEGESSYNLKQLMNLALNIILAYSDKPIRIIIKMGMIISLTSFFYAFYTLWKLFTGSIKVSGYASLIISIWFLSGVIIVTLGMIGLYVGKIFEGVKNRPIYIIGNKINLK